VSARTVTYEAGPIGFRPHRAITAAGVRWNRIQCSDAACVPFQAFPRSTRVHGTRAVSRAVPGPLRVSADVLAGPAQVAGLLLGHLGRPDRTTPPTSRADCATSAYLTTTPTSPRFRASRPTHSAERWRPKLTRSTTRRRPALNWATPPRQSRSGTTSTGGLWFLTTGQPPSASRPVAWQARTLLLSAEPPLGADATGVHRRAPPVYGPSAPRQRLPGSDARRVDLG
jgi:hypothetical protein